MANFVNPYDIDDTGFENKKLFRVGYQPDWEKYIFE